MGFVYRAHDTRLDRDVAVKVLPPGTIYGENARRRFRREALALAKLNHPNIAVIHDFDTQAGIDFLVMELVTGMSLSDKLMVAGPLPEKQIYSLSGQIARALACAHDAEIVHRDLKPGNVMLSPVGDVKLLDFGLSVLLTHAEEDTMRRDTVTAQRVTGTLPYMAPEQLRGEPLDSRCDIYALGVVMYEMATGHAPFEGKASGALIDDILHTQVPRPQTAKSQISVGLSEIILKCLEKDPEHRYQSVKDLIVDLQRTATASASMMRVTGTTRALERTVRQNRGLLAVMSLIGLLLLVSFAVGRWRGSRSEQGAVPPPNQAKIQSIAVLPLENLSGDAKQEYFADGMTEELIGALTKISSLRVISRTSAMQYKNAHKPLPQIAKELHVNAVVEGSVARLEKPDRVRVSAQLIDAASDRSLWSETYERGLGDVFAMQDEVARNIARQIRAQLTPEDQQRLASARPVNTEAHEAYLQGRYHWQRGTEEQFREAKADFEQAIQIDPTYALAYVGLADYYWGTDNLPPRLAIPKAKELAQKALTLDENLSDAHTTLGSIKFYYDWDWTGAEKEFQRAIALGPSNAEAHRMYALFLAQMGRSSDAIRQIQYALELDPVSFSTSVTAGWIHYFARDYDRALELCNASLQTDPKAASGHECLSSSYLEKGKSQAAIAQAQVIAPGPASDPVRMVALARSYAVAGDMQHAGAVLSELVGASKAHYVPPYFLSIVTAAMGQKEQAFFWLQRAYDQRDAYMVRLKVDTAMDPLRSDPRFQSLLQRMRLAP